MSKKLVGFRLEEEISIKLKMHALENKTTIQKILEDYVLELLKKERRSRLHPHS